MALFILYKHFYGPWNPLPNLEQSSGKQSQVTVINNGLFFFPTLGTLSGINDAFIFGN